PVIGTTSSQNPLSPSSRESHQRAKRSAGLMHLGQCRELPGVIAGECALTHIAGRRSSACRGASLNKSAAISHSQTPVVPDRLIFLLHRALRPRPRDRVCEPPLPGRLSIVSLAASRTL